jgi:hypothetical protein
LAQPSTLPSHGDLFRSEAYIDGHDPHYQVLRVAAVTSHSMGAATLSFELRQEERQLLNQRKLTVLLRSFRQKTGFPECTPQSVFVNSRNVQVPVATTKKSSMLLTPFYSLRPVDLTLMLGKSTSNTCYVMIPVERQPGMFAKSHASSVNNAGLFVILVARPLESHELPAFIPMIEGTVSEAAAADDAIQAMVEDVSLLCPLTQGRIAVPAKGVTCSHFQCFDLQGYIELCRQSKSWCCPICFKPLPPSKLRRVKFFMDLLALHPEPIERVRIHPDGQLEALSALPSDLAATLPLEPQLPITPKRSAEAILISLDDDDDDDEQTIRPAKMMRRADAAPVTSSSRTAASASVSSSTSSQNKRHESSHSQVQSQSDVIFID